MPMNFFMKFNKLNIVIKNLVWNEIDNLDHLTYGYRYSDQFKNFCLYIFISSPKCYKLFKHFFTIPSKETLLKHMNPDLMKTGLNDAMIECLSKYDLQNEVGILLLDEVSLKPFLNYHPEDDLIDGIEDLGELRSKPSIAKYALTFMLTFYHNSIRIPLCFFFGSSSVSGTNLKVLVINTIERLFKSKIKIHVIVCDQGTTNQSMFNSLGISPDKQYFDMNIDGVSHRVFCTYDPPHVIKAIRNNLINYKLSYNENEKEYVADWNDVKLTFEKDQQERITMIPKISSKHVNPNNFQKMKVSYAVQVFSHSFSCAMKMLTDDQSTIGTQKLLGILNDVFDLLNNKDCVETKYLKFNNLAWQKLDSFLKVLKSFKFQTQNNKQQSKISCVRNLIISIRSMMGIHQFLEQNYGIDYLLTKKFIQDPLENFFSAIRHDSNENNQLRCITFRRTFIAFQYSSFLKRKLSDKKNCIDGDNNCSFNHIFEPKRTNDSSSDTSFESESDLDLEPNLHSFFQQLHFMSNESLEIDQSFIDSNFNIGTCAYVGGFVLRKLKLIICSECFLGLQHHCGDSEHLKFTIIKQYEGSKLYKPSSQYAKYIQTAIHFFFSEIDNFIFTDRPRSKLCSNFKSSIDQIKVGDCCDQLIANHSITILFNTLIKHHLGRFNEKLSSKFVQSKKFLELK